MRQTWVEIDLSALDHNIKEIKRVIGNNEIIGVVKADAYGHGSVRCAEVLRDNGVQRFAVATIEEALELREAGFNESIPHPRVSPRGLHRYNNRAEPYDCRRGV